jgi:hypothetical protein
MIPTVTSARRRAADPRRRVAALPTGATAPPAYWSEERMPGPPGPPGGKPPLDPYGA